VYNDFLKFFIIELTIPQVDQSLSWFVGKLSSKHVLHVVKLYWQYVNLCLLLECFTCHIVAISDSHCMFCLFLWIYNLWRDAIDVTGLLKICICRMWLWNY